MLFRQFHITLLPNPSLCSLVQMGVQMTKQQLWAGTASTACSALLFPCTNHWGHRLDGCFPTCLAHGKVYLPSAAGSVQTGVLLQTLPGAIPTSATPPGFVQSHLLSSSFQGGRKPVPKSRLLNRIRAFFPPHIKWERRAGTNLQVTALSLVTWIQF